MDDIIKTMEAFIKYSKNMQASRPFTYKPKKRWEKLLSLLSDGWKADKCTRTEAGDLIFELKKEEKEERVQLSYVEQCKLIELLQGD